MSDVCMLYLPSPPKMNVFRHWAGGYGTALPSQREYPGHDQQYFDVPYLQFLFIGRVLKDKHFTVTYENLQKTERFVSSDFLKKLREKKPKILLTNLSLPSLEADLKFLKTIKDEISLPIVLIGSVAKLFQQRILKEHFADFIIMAHEELLAAEVIEAISKGNTTPKGAFYWKHDSVTGEISELTIRDLNFVDFPAYELLDFTDYQSTYPFNKMMRYTTVATSKGCPYPCSYCPYPIGFGKKVLYRKPELVVADIKKLVDDFGIEFIVFRDQLLTLNRGHCEAIFHGLIDNNIKLIWLCETRYDLVDKGLLQLMYKAGCREINFGLESGDETLFASVGKAKAKQGLDYFGKVIQDTKEVGIKCHTHLMLGLPDDNWKSIKKTIRFLKKYKPDSVQTAIFIPYPGTPLGDQLEKEGLLKNTNYLDYTGFKPVIPTEHMSIEEIEEAKAYIGTVWNRTFLTRVKDKIRKFYEHAI